TTASPTRLIIGVTGATGAPLAVRLLEILREVPQVETHLVLSTWARSTIEVETPYTSRHCAELADVTHKFGDLGATISPRAPRTSRSAGRAWPKRAATDPCQAWTGGSGAADGADGGRGRPSCPMAQMAALAAPPNSTRVSGSRRTAR
ncbi:flavoprotein, partial [Streptomyces celluloflavus]|uniref:flavoprotein n=1 Tax=Streptomyces celluloflavus TaxID=58344 RepID=UPI0036CC544C